MGGDPITSDQYLESALKLKPGETMYLSYIRNNKNKKQLNIFSVSCPLG